MGGRVLCGKTAGGCMGVLEVEAFMNPFIARTSYDKTYSVNYTRRGLKHVYRNHKEAAAKSCKLYGYYNQCLEGHEFYVCKACLDSEDFGLLALQVL
jgi:hypothetical protein